MEDTIKAGFWLVVVGGILLALLLVVLPSGGPGDRVYLDSLPIDSPNLHALLKHPETTQSVMRDKKCPFWVRFDNPFLHQSMYCDKDPYEVDDKELVRTVFVGWEDIILGAGAVVLLGAYMLTAFSMPARRVKKVIERDGYKR